MILLDEIHSSLKDLKKRSLFRKRLVVSERKENQIKIIELTKLKYFKFLPKNGFFKSRFSYILIFLISFIPLSFRFLCLVLKF